MKTRSERAPYLLFSSSPYWESAQSFRLKANPRNSLLISKNRRTTICRSHWLPSSAAWTAYTREEVSRKIQRARRALYRTRATSATVLPDAAKVSKASFPLVTAIVRKKARRRRISRLLSSVAASGCSLSSLARMSTVRGSLSTASFGLEEKRMLRKYNTYYFLSAALFTPSGR